MNPRVEQAVRGAVLGTGAWIIASALGASRAAGLGVAVPLLASLLLGALLSLAGRERLLLWLASVPLVLLLVAAFTPVVPALGRTLARDDPPQAVDAIVILGAGVNFDGLTDGTGLERMLSGFDHVAPGDSTPVVLSVVRPATTNRLDNGADLAHLVARFGARRVIYQHDVFSTRDEAIGAAAIARTRGWRRLAVVTSPVHSRRACRTFERVGLTVACWPSQERGARVARASTTAERAQAAAAVTYEVLGWLAYTVRGWI
ncbi:MAG: YdcF family protein [Gemmatimonadetes bacterium]|nr:YdcF family protein [Gemmatimonadota bacterium]